MLCSGALYFASPDSLNDLFEMRIDLDVKIENEEVLFKCVQNLLCDKKFISSIEAEIGPVYLEMLRSLNFEQFKRDLSLKSTIESLAKEVAKMRRFDIEELGVCCFASSPINKLMWAHYTDDNKGFCVEFKNQSWLGKKSIKVKYFDEYPKINIVDVLNNPNLYIDLVSAKSSDWSYEGEFRALKEGKGEYPFPKELIESIIFGYKMEENDRNELVNQFSDFKNIKFREVIMVKGQFELELREL